MTKLSSIVLPILLSVMLFLTGCAPGDGINQAAITVPEATEQVQAGPIIEPQAIADYLFEHGELPDNFITKKEAQALGWGSGKNLNDYAPGKSIGGDYFGNYEGILPKDKGQKYHEADCYYTGGKRRAERIVYSSDGHVYYTEDHYATFTELFPSNSKEGSR